ncbi:MAG: DNA cytosine methyltransferase, partial [Gemmatimonadales bacterium]
MLDLFCGRWGWSKAFAALGWECVGVDLVEPLDVPAGCEFIKADILGLKWNPSLKFEDYRRKSRPCFELYGGPKGYQVVGDFDFICASSPCEQFSVHGMKHFHPNPKYPEMGLKLFNHTRTMCEASGLPYIMENVRA